MALDLRSWLSVSVFALAAGGCGGKANEVDTYGMQVERRITVARCERLRDAACQSVSVGSGTVATCAETYLNVARAHAIDRGTVVVDEGALERCLAETPCLPPVLGSPAVAAGDPWVACLSAFSGAMPAGSGCYLDEECDTGLRCDRGATSFCGSCVPKLAPGDACTRDAECSHTASLDVGMCVDGACAHVSVGVAAVVDQPCGLQSTGPGTVDSVACAPGLFCSRNGSALLHCVEPVGDGGDCVALVCAPGLACQGGSCRPVQTVAGVGTPCGPAPDGAYVGCDAEAGLHCDGHNCVRSPAEGEPCMPLDVPCASGTTCTGGVCTAPAGSGRACSTSAQCVSGACVSGACVSGVCGA